MNEWIKRSIQVANSPGYLDALSEIYVMKINPERPIFSGKLAKIKQAFEEKNTKELIKLLIENAKVFPVKDSYIGFLRAKKEAMDENPKTVDRIGNRLYKLGFERMIREASRPKETNRQLGPMFKNWLRHLGYVAVNKEEMLESISDVCILGGGDRALASFAKEELGCQLKKGIDFVIKIKTEYIIGEAKFLTTPGGEQDRGFDDASSFISDASGNAKRIAILDGYIWLESLQGIRQKIIQSDKNIMSALVLKDFIRSQISD